MQLWQASSFVSPDCVRNLNLSESFFVGVYGCVGVGNAQSFGVLHVFDANLKREAAAPTIQQMGATLNN